jgi:hypothetical protein
MCGRVLHTESVSTVLGVLSCLYEDRPEDASLLMDIYSRACHDNGAEDNCVLASMLSASVYVTMSLMGEQGKERVSDLNMWWAAQCPN